MPRNINPADITTGSGKQASEDSSLTLGGAGMVGAGPNIGELEGYSPVGEGSGAALKAHIESGNAHSASSIYTEQGPSTLPADHVEGELDDLAGNLPPEPPTLGYIHTHLGFTGIPDWGLLKLRDVPLQDSVPAIAGPNDPEDVFPYYYETPTPTADPEFSDPGNDPQSDYTFNSGLSGTDNLGTAATGAYTRPPMGPGPVVPSTAILDRGGSAQQFIVSGSLYPADRGVLALLHWPADGDVAAFLAQDLLDRVKCAILLGQGILGKGPCADGSCDGGVGGIFDPGTDSNDHYDPFQFPGQASGQYDLKEICNGVSSIDGSPLKSPWDDKNGDGTPGWKRVLNEVLPGPGQVRLGTDPTAGVTPEPYGIPVLGGDEDLYDDGTGTPPVAPFTDIPITPSGEWYFRYRLPYLSDYSQTTGLKWTPSGVSGTETTTKEKARFFSVPPTVTPGVTELSQAGDYPDFPGDAYAWQVARFRLSCNLKFTGTVNDYQEHGTYFFVHFKREADFEAFVRDGILPDDLTAGYEVYSAWLAPTTAIEDIGNRVNEETSTTVFAPQGPAPDYGYKAEPYHITRVNVFEDPSGYQVDPLDVLQYETVFTGSDTMTVSGVGYYVPRDPTTGLSSASLQVDVQVDDFWQNSYRTDDRPLSGVLGNTAPALLSSPNPAFIGLAAFSYEDGTFTTSTGAAGSFYTLSSYYFRRQRLEIPYTHLDGAGAFSSLVGPTSADILEIDGSSYTDISFTGDISEPSFTTDARARVYLRLPLGNTSLNPDEGIQPINPGTGFGMGVYTGDVSGDRILFHSTSFEPVNLLGDFSNSRQTGAAPTPAYAVLLSSSKDREERFLDETYRWFPELGLSGTLDALYGGNPAEAAIDGPGLGAWLPSPIDVPVQISATQAPSVWQPVSVLENDAHLITFNNAAGYPGSSLQVAGLPDRNPALRYNQAVPFPSRGILIYPQKDYSSGYSPVGPDYSALTGTRSYIRCFDASLGGAVSAAGQPFFLIRLDGLTLSDFSYAAPGPGKLNGDEGIAILAKVPGLTTWMDIGRPDGSGPSKQDASLDGAGCQVVGPNTFDDVDDETQVSYCQVEVNVGPAVNLFAATGVGGASGIPPTDVGKVPVLIQVRMGINAIGFNFEDQYVGPPAPLFSGSPSPDKAPGDVRGLVGISMV